MGGTSFKLNILMDFRCTMIILNVDEQLACGGKMLGLLAVESHSIHIYASFCFRFPYFLSDFLSSCDDNCEHFLLYLCMFFSCLGKVIVGVYIHRTTPSICNFNNLSIQDTHHVMLKG